LQLNPYTGVALSNLARDYIALNRLDEAKATLDEAEARKLDQLFARQEIYH
jgi:hypothetical protein